MYTATNIGKLAPIVGGVAQATALAALNATNGACAAAAGRAGTYFVEYPENIKLWGLSANTAGPAGIALQGEYTYRSNQPLQLPSAELLLAALGGANQLTSTNPAAAAAVPYGTEISGYRRVKMHQLQATATKAFGPTFNANQLVTVGEIGYTHLDLPGDLKFAGPGCHLPQPGSSTCHFVRFDLDQLLRDQELLGLSPRRPARLRRRGGRRDAVAAHRLCPRCRRRRSHVQRGRQGPDARPGVRLSAEVAGRYRLHDVLRWQHLLGHRRRPSPPLPPGQTASYASGSNYLKDRDFLAISVSYSF